MALKIFLTKLIKFNHNGLHTKNSKELVYLYMPLGLVYTSRHWAQSYAFRYIPVATGHNHMPLGTYQLPLGTIMLVSGENVLINRGPPESP